MTAIFAQSWYYTLRGPLTTGDLTAIADPA